MVCTYCGSALAVTNSRSQKQLNQTWRRRQCQSCSGVFTTLEGVDYSKAIAVQRANKSLEPFRRDKLFVSILKSCGHRQNALEGAASITATAILKVTENLRDGLITHTQITRFVVDILRRYDTVAAAHYEAYHQTASKTMATNSHQQS